jgi:hypothetical protein
VEKETRQNAVSSSSFLIPLHRARADVCLFVVYLTTLFQYLRLYSVDFYSILIRLPSSSEAGETRVRNMTEFCRRVLIVLVGFFYMP